MAGHGRVEAAKLFGPYPVPTIRLDHMSEAQKRAFIVADNRLAELAGWDRELLAIEFAELSTLEIDFDLEITGFETAEIDRLIEIAGLEPAKTRPTRHSFLGMDLRSAARATCGSWASTSCSAATPSTPASYRRLMAAERARLVFTDAPYKVRVQGHVCGNGRIRHAEFAMALRRDVRGGVHRFLARSLDQHGAGLPRRGGDLCLHGSPARLRAPAGQPAGRAALSQSLRLEQGEWRPRLLLSVET